MAEVEVRQSPPQSNSSAGANSASNEYFDDFSVAGLYFLEFLCCTFVFFLIFLGFRREPFGCSLCHGDKVMAFPDRIIPNTNGTTCFEYQERELSQVSILRCDYFRNASAETHVIDILAFCGCEGAPISTTCSICEGSSFTGEIIDTTSGEQLKCGSVVEELMPEAQFIRDQDYCENLKVFAGSCCNVSLEGYERDSEPCPFCHDSDSILIDPSYHLPSKKGVKCADAQELAGFFLADSDICMEEFASFAAGCCAGPDRCSICTNSSSTILYPKRKLPFVEDGATCMDVEFHLGSVGEIQCRNFLQGISFVDYAAWCGCEGPVTIAQPSCSLCGDDFKLIQAGKQIPDAPIGVTCGIIAEWAPYIVEPHFCDETVLVLRSECCGLPLIDEQSSSTMDVEQAMISPSDVQSGANCMSPSISALTMTSAFIGIMNLY